MKINKVVVFDLDDTLYNEIDYVKSAFSEISNKISVLSNIEKDLIYNDLISFYYSKANPFKEIIKKYSVPFTINDLLFLYRHHRPHLFLTDDRLEVLNFLKNSNIPIGLITDGRSIQQRNKLNALNIIDFFSEILISEEFGSEKPSLENYKHFENKFGDALYYYVGDNTNKDFVSPNMLGWTTICLLNNGTNIHEQNFNMPKKFLPTYRINNFHELTKIIKE